MQVPAEKIAFCGNIEVGDVNIDVRQRVVIVASKPEKFTRREFDMLCHLAMHPGWAFTKEQLLDAVCGNTTDANYHAVETMIYWIRKKIRSSSNVQIHTMVTSLLFSRNRNNLELN